MSPRLPHLTGRQARFVDEYTTDRNGTRAYLAAGFRVRNGDRQLAAQKASALLRRPQVREAIERRQAEYAAALCQRVTPLTLMMSNLLYWHDIASAPDDGTLQGRARCEEARRQAQVVAVQAAPFVHPKLQPVAARTGIRRSLDDFTDAELRILISTYEEFDAEPNAI